MKVLRRRATCHPTRGAYDSAGRCRICIQLEGTTGLGRIPLPPLIEGTVGNRGPVMPAACWKCQAAPPLWRRIPEEAPRYGSCLTCGADFYLTTARVVERGRDQREDARQTRGLPPAMKGARS